MALLRAPLIVDSSDGTYIPVVLHSMYVSRMVHAYTAAAEPNRGVLHRRACRAGARQGALHRNPCRFVRPAVARFWEDGTAPADGRGHSRSRRIITRPVMYFVIPSQWNMYVPAATVCFRGRTEARSEPSMFVGPLAATDQSRLARRRVRLCSSRGRVEIGRWTVVEALVREVPHVWAGGIVNNTQDRPSPNHRNHMVKTQNTLLCTSVRDIVGTV